MLDNVPEFVFWLEAAALAGAVVVGANPTHRGDELVRDLSHTECQFLITDSTYLPLVEGARIGDALGEVGPDQRARAGARHRPGAAHARGVRVGRRREVADRSVTPDTLGYLLFTSGTSGAPKACLCSQGRLARIGAIVAQMYALEPGDVCYLSMPLFHSNALDGRLGPGADGGLGRRAPLVGPVLRLGLPARRAGGRRDLLQLRRQAAVLHSGHARATRRRRQPAGARLRQRGDDRRRGPLRRALRRRRHRLLRLDRRGRHGAADPRHAAGRAGAGARGHRRPRPGHRGRVPAGPLRRPRPAAQRRGGHRRAGVQGRWRRLRGLLAQRGSRDGPPARRAGTGRATWPTATRPASSTSPAGTTTGCGSTGRTSPRPRSSGSCSVTPTSCWPRSTPCPTPSWATRSWRRCSCGPVSMRSTAEELLAFLAAQGDLGTKWTPRFVRMSAELPATATNKVLKRSLRAERWNCAGAGAVAGREGRGIRGCSMPTTPPRSRRRVGDRPI